MKHKHSVKSCDAKPFMGCVNPKRCNNASHGWMMYASKCECGAFKYKNVNQYNVESSEWMKHEHISMNPPPEEIVCHGAWTWVDFCLCGARRMTMIHFFGDSIVEKRGDWQ